MDAVEKAQSSLAKFIQAPSASFSYLDTASNDAIFSTLYDEAITGYDQFDSSRETTSTSDSGLTSPHDDASPDRSSEPSVATKKPRVSNHNTLHIYSTTMTDFYRYFPQGTLTQLKDAIYKTHGISVSVQTLCRHRKKLGVPTQSYTRHDRSKIMDLIYELMMDNPVPVSDLVSTYAISSVYIYTLAHRLRSKSSGVRLISLMITSRRERNLPLPSLIQQMLRENPEQQEVSAQSIYDRYMLLREQRQAALSAVTVRGDADQPK